jgi:hypothetical protein
VSGIPISQPSRSHSRRQSLVGAQAPDVAREWIECTWQAAKQTERPKNAQDVLETDSDVRSLDALNGAAREPGAIGELRLREAAQLPPGLDVLGDLSPCTPNRQWSLPRRIFHLKTHITIII